jgi:putative peptidoglycan lipid II flippase
MGYGCGLLGLVAIKVLAPGFYANQDIKTPVGIAVLVLCLTQLFNLLLVPIFAHAGLALSIGLGAMVNAGLLLWGLRRRGSYQPEPGWAKFALQVGVGCTLLACYLFWANQAVPWVALRSQSGLRIGYLALVMLGSALLYLGALWACGVQWRPFVKR